MHVHNFITMFKDLSLLLCISLCNIHVPFLQRAVVKEALSPAVCAVWLCVEPAPEAERERSVCWREEQRLGFSLCREKGGDSN